MGIMHVHVTSQEHKKSMRVFTKMATPLPCSTTRSGPALYTTTLYTGEQQKQQGNEKTTTNDHIPRKRPPLRKRVLLGPADPPTTAVGDCATDPHRPSPAWASAAPCSDASDSVVLLAIDTLSCVLASLRRVVVANVTPPLVMQLPSMVVCSMATAAAMVTGACMVALWCTRWRFAGLSSVALVGLTALPSTAGGAPGVGSCCVEK